MADVTNGNSRTRVSRYRCELDVLFLSSGALLVVEPSCTRALRHLVRA